jgi:phage-related holin
VEYFTNISEKQSMRDGSAIKSYIYNQNIEISKNNPKLHMVLPQMTKIKLNREKIF